MEEPSSRGYYRGRAMVIERVNAVVKGTLGQGKLPVRGVERVRSWVLLIAVIANLLSFRHMGLEPPKRASAGLAEAASLTNRL